MRTRYEHLQPEDRVTLASLRQQGWSIRAIARLQGRSPSTISRELRRNACNGSYASAPAQRLCQQRRIQARPCPKLHSSGALWMLVTTMLCWLWSPQQIARTLQRMYPQEPNMHASHESIYTVSVRQSHLDRLHDAVVAPQMAGDQRCGSSSSIRLAGWVGKRSSTSLRYA